MYPTKSPGCDGMPYFSKIFGTLLALMWLLVSRIFYPQAGCLAGSIIHILPLSLRHSDRRRWVSYVLLVLLTSWKLLCHDVISPNQSAFIDGQLIFDNTLLAAEIAHFMHQRKPIKLIWTRLTWKKWCSTLGLRNDGFTLSCSTFVQFLTLFLLMVPPMVIYIPRLGYAKGNPYHCTFFFCVLRASLLWWFTQRHHHLPIYFYYESPPFCRWSFFFAQATMEDCEKIIDILQQYKRESGQKVNL